MCYQRTHKENEMHLKIFDWGIKFHYISKIETSMKFNQYAKLLDNE